MKSLFCFDDPNMTQDLVDEKGRVKRHKQIAVIGTSIDNAREYGKVPSEYQFLQSTPLSKHWDNYQQQ